MSLAKPRNLLFIMADEHARDALGCYGNKKIRTPNLDRLAAGGTRFAKVRFRFAKFRVICCRSVADLGAADCAFRQTAEAIIPAGRRHATVLCSPGPITRLNEIGPCRTVAPYDARRRRLR